MNYAITVICFCAIIIGAVFGIGYRIGYDKKDSETAVQIAKLNAENAQKTNTLVQQISDKDAELQKEKTNAKKEIAKRDADIATGKLQLYVKTAPNSSCSNAPSTSGSDPSYARIDPAFAESLVRITDDGDSAIRKLNACLQIYNQVRTMINGFPNPR